MSSIIFVTLSVYFLALLGMLFRPTYFITYFVSLEIQLMSIVVGFSTSSVIFDDITGQVFSLIILTRAAAESSVGLAVLVNYYRCCRSIEIRGATLLKG